MVGVLGKPCKSFAEHPQVARSQQAQQQCAGPPRPRRSAQQAVQPAVAGCCCRAGPLQQARQPFGRCCPSIAACWQRPPQEGGHQRRGQRHADCQEGQSGAADRLRLRLAWVRHQRGVAGGVGIERRLCRPSDDWTRHRAEARCFSTRACDGGLSLGHGACPWHRPPQPAPTCQPSHAGDKRHARGPQRCHGQRQ